MTRFPQGNSAIHRFQIAVCVLAASTTSATALAQASTNIPKPTPESTQAAQADTPTQGEIIVTANRTEQRLQDVGISATVLDNASLVARGVTSTDAIVTVTPGLQIAQPGGPGLTSLISIRGVSQNDFAGHLESPNTFYVDDVYQAAPSANTQPLFDVRRVEVLKGPQGTLFGRNSVGGLINVLTGDPEDRLSGYINGELGSYSRVRLDGAINVPLGNTVAARLAFYKSNQNGYIRNVFNDTRQNGDNSFGLRGKLKLDFGDQLSALVSADYFEFTSDTANVAFMQGAIVNADGLGVTTPGRPTAYGYVDADGDPYTVAADFNGALRRRNSSVGLKFTYEFEDATLVSQSSAGWAKSFYAEDNDSSPLDYTRFFQRSQSSNFTQELRLFGTSEKGSWTVGAFYLNIDGGPYGQRFELRDSGPSLIGVINAGLDTSYSLKTSSWSLFGQYAYNLSQALTVTAGARYTRDRKTFAYDFQCASLGPGLGCAIGLNPPPGSQGAGSPVRDRFSEGGVSGRLALEYKPSDDLLLYASYNRGYKAFSYNVGFAGLTPLSGVRFKGETMNAFEIGEKLSFLDGRGRLNLSAFFYDYRNYQAFDQRGLNLTLYNTSAKLKGLEAEFGIRGGGWTFDLSGTLLDATVDNVPLPNGSVSRRPPQAPEFTLLAAVSKTVTLAGGEVMFSANGVYTGAAFAQLTNAPNTLLPANVIGNTRIAYKPNGGALEVAVFSRNVFNNRAPRYAFDITAPLLGATEQNYGIPRTFGASLTARF